MSEEPQEKPKSKINKIVNKNSVVETLFILSRDKIFLLSF